ncbi:MAG: O-antigen ligase family protein [Solirubrobacteraceae bacterium]|nr:O-antigen ligase family protein [Solirubrobacteraceae bacterium]
MLLDQLAGLPGLSGFAPDALVQGAVIAAPVRDLTSILIAALVAIALVARAPAARWTAAITALVLAPVLLAGAVLEDDRANRLLDHPLLLLVGGLGALVLLAAATAVFVRWPVLLPVLIAIAIPLRLPIVLGGESVNLLLPLYGLIGAGAVAFAVRARQRGKRLAQSWDLRSGPSTADVLRDAWTAKSLSGAAAAVPVLLAVSVVLYALRIPFSEDADRGVQTLCFFLVPFSVLFIVLREVHFDRPQLVRVGVALVGLALVAVALGNYEYVTGEVLWKQNVLDATSLNATVRVNSLFFDPNIYGRFLMVVLLGLLSALAWGARGWRVAVYAVLFAVIWVGLLFTYSQSSMLGLLVGALVLLGLRFGAGRAVGAGATLVVIGLVGVFVFSDQLRIDTGGGEQSCDVATSGRCELIMGGVRLFESKPIFGWGSGSYRVAYRQQEGATGVKAVAASHTIPITVAAEQGIIGLLAYLALIVAAVAALLRRARESMARAAIAAAFIAVIVHSWLYAAFLEDPLTWALLAVGLNLGAESEDGSDADGDRGSDAVDPPTPHDVVGPVTLVGVGEGEGPGVSVGESGAPKAPTDHASTGPDSPPSPGGPVA